MTQGCSQAPPSITSVLRPLATLHALHNLESDLAWLLTEGLVDLAFAKAVPVHIRYLLPLNSLLMACKLGSLPVLAQMGALHASIAKAEVLRRALCQELAGSSQQLVDSFGIDDHLLAAPIAGDWVRYNAVDNQGELTGPAFA